jgi:predicted ATPase
LEERKFIREKIRSAYKRKMESLEQLLETCAAIEEELLLAAAPSRLDYFKAGVHFERRVVDKVSQLQAVQTDAAAFLVALVLE